MTEPLYTFVRGQGWVIQTHESLTKDFGTVIVTLTHRMPTEGERFWSDSRSLQETMENSFGPDTVASISKVTSNYHPGAIWSKEFAERFTDPLQLNYQGERRYLVVIEIVRK
jgi:hypothetical protein